MKRLCSRCSLRWLLSLSTRLLLAAVRAAIHCSSSPFVSHCSLAIATTHVFNALQS